MVNFIYGKKLSWKKNLGQEKNNISETPSGGGKWQK